MGARRGLIIFPGALGDLICLLPAIRALSGRYPNIEFELMARAELARFAERRMPIVAGHSIDRRELALFFSEGGSESNLVRKFFRQFDRIDCFFASDNERFCSSLRQAARSEVSFYPFRPPGRGHVAECYLRAIGAGISPPPSGSIQLLPDDMHDAEQRLRAIGLEPGHFVLVFPGSGSARKNWPAENFALLAKRIQLIHRVLVVLGPAETGMASGFHARSLSVVSDLGLGELAGIARLARCFIGNDSGVSHLAAAAGARGLVIFGPSDPERWRPFGDVKIIQKEPLESLLPEQVWPAVAELIEAAY
ncbi:MAG: glycosyltransferase family 9 protein [Deltaproteobacteria bacterium]|nr:glycosyltransferase family 9 protein [Deltaproteobacteria bacterium]